MAHEHDRPYRSVAFLRGRARAARVRARGRGRRPESSGHRIVDVEQEFVVLDDNPRIDGGWLEPLAEDGTAQREDRMRTAPAGSPDYPPTYRPAAAATGSGEVPPAQRAAFDPALKQYPNAYRAGEPRFSAPQVGARWKGDRRGALHDVLNVIAGTAWAQHLVLRGSLTMPAWVGDAAREPGDLDFVVTPATVTSTSATARTLMADLKTALRSAPPAGLRPDDLTETAIWTYERADGLRLALPFDTPDLTGGHVQIDVVFGEHLPLPPRPLTLPGVAVPVLAAPAPLALAWKLMWLATDAYPQGKDLYDAALLAEHTHVDQALVQDLLRPELGTEADTFTAATVLDWDVDWANFLDEDPAVTGTSDHWLGRLAIALEQAWAGSAHP